MRPIYPLISPYHLYHLIDCLFVHVVRREVHEPSDIGGISVVEGTPQRKAHPATTEMHRGCGVFKVSPNPNFLYDYNAPGHKENVIL